MSAADVHGGVPQNRPRLYVVGIGSDHTQARFVWPSPIPCLTLEQVLEPFSGDPSLVETMNDTKRNNFSISLKKHKGTDPESHAIAELGSSYPKCMVGRCPCLTATRAGDTAYWSIRLRRPLTMSELLKLQGFNEALFPDWQNVVSSRQFGTMIGNSMTLSVMRRLMAAVLHSLGHTVRVTD